MNKQWVLVGALALSVQAMSQNVTYSYDASGNRVRRCGLEEGYTSGISYGRISRGVVVI